MDITPSTGKNIKNKKKTTINLLYKDWHYPDK